MYIGDLSNTKFVESLPTVDVVINCAAVQYVTQKKPYLYWSNWFYKNNVKSISNLVSKYKKCEHFIHIATSMMYEQNFSPIYYEGSNLKGSGPYSLSKVIAQNILDSSDIPSATIVPCIIGGKGREGLFIKLVNTIMNKKIMLIPGSGVFYSNMVHVDDVADLIILALTNRYRGRLNAAASIPLSLLQWIEIVENTLNKEVSKIFIPHSIIKFLGAITFGRILAREQIIMLGQNHILDCTNSFSLGWKPKFNNQELLVDLIGGLIDE